MASTSSWADLYLPNVSLLLRPGEQRRHAVHCNEINLVMQCKQTAAAAAAIEGT
jgi:hypothetical protein